ncbi:MAG: RDD family protein [Flavobacteriales bacterium]|jgi:uncharacterized RDD family membrane protein YckC|nr:RDD family protein [Flavobacteriales bacterium]
MKNIEVITAHNVVIQYEIAPVFYRILAFLLDALILFFYWLFALFLMSAFTIGSLNFFDGADSLAVLFFVLLLIPMFFYSFFMETFFAGQTVGKMVLGLRVINVNGATPSIGDLFLRWSFRLLEVVISAGSIAILSMLVNEKKQRLGGIVSNTLVIQLKSSNSYSIRNILSLKSIENHKVTYPNVVQFTDEDVLLIKNSLERQNKFKNKAHNEVLLTLSKKSSQKLNLEQEPKNKIKFLKTIVQDYVVLTRS